MATSKLRDWTPVVEDDAGADARPWPARAFEWVRHPSLLVGLVVYVVVLVVCIAGPLISRQSPNLQNGDLVFMKPSLQHPFGTDSFGRDVLTRVLYGGRSTVLGSFLVVAIGAPIGSALGLVAGYFRGLAGLVIMRLMDLLLAFPGILLALTVAAILGPGLINGVVAVAIVSIPAYARVVEGATMEIRSVPYVEAAITTGAGPLHIMWRHVLPNVFAGIAVLGSSWLGIAALWIASLGYLGLGVQPPQSEWGTMLNDGQSYITVAWWISFFPGVVLSAYVIASNLLGDGLRDRLDPTLGRARGRSIG